MDRLLVLAAVLERLMVSVLGSDLTWELSGAEVTMPI